MKTLADIRDYVRAKIHDVQSPYWRSDTELNNDINAAIIQVATLVPAMRLTTLQKIAEYNITPSGTPLEYEVSLPSDYFRPVALLYYCDLFVDWLPGRLFEHGNQSIEDMYRWNYIGGGYLKGWVTETKLHLEGFAQDASTHKVRFIYLRKPTLLVDDSDEPDLPPDLIPLIEIQAVINAAEATGLLDPQGYKEELQNLVARMWIKEHGGRNEA